MNNRILRNISLLLLLFVLLQFPFAARARFRGDEYELRDWAIGNEYFLDYYTILPRLESRLAYRDALHAYQAYAGSFDRDDMFWFQNLKLRTPLEGPFYFGFNFDGGQDFDTAYTEFMGSIGYTFVPKWSVELLAAPALQKEYFDVGLALERRDPDSLWRLEFILPNFLFNKKNDVNGAYFQTPYCLRWNIYQPLSDELQFFTTGNMDFPSDTNEGELGFDFKFNSYKPAVGVIWDLDDQQRVWAECNVEITDKQRIGHQAADTNDYTIGRRFYSARLEYVWHEQSGYRFAAGFIYSYFDESNDFPFSDAETYDLYDHSRIPYVTYSLPMYKALSFVSGCYVDFVQHTAVYPGDEEKTFRIDDLRWKIPFALNLTGRFFSVETGIAVISVFGNTSGIAFGGGYVNGYVVF